MRRIYPIIVGLVFLKLCCAADEVEDLRASALRAQTRLEEMIYTPIQAGIADLNYALASLRNRTRVVQFGHTEIIRSHASSVRGTVGSLTDIYRSFGLSVTSCMSSIENQLTQTEDNGIMSIEVTANELLSDGEMITYNLLPVLAAAQNRTLALRLTVQDCISLEDDSCLRLVIGEIEVRQNTLPLLIDTAFTEHQTKMVTLDERIASDLRQIANGVREEYVNVLDIFLNCIV